MSDTWVAGGKADELEKNNRSGRFDRVTSFIFVSVLAFHERLNGPLERAELVLHEQSGRVFCYTAVERRGSGA